MEKMARAFGIRRHALLPRCCTVYLNPHALMSQYPAEMQIHKEVHCGMLTCMHLSCMQAASDTCMRAQATMPCQLGLNLGTGHQFLLRQWQNLLKVGSRHQIRTQELNLSWERKLSPFIFQLGLSSEQTSPACA